MKLLRSTPVALTFVNTIALIFLFKLYLNFCVYGLSSHFKNWNSRRLKTIKLWCLKKSITKSTYFEVLNKFLLLNFVNLAYQCITIFVGVPLMLKPWVRPC